MAVNVRRPQYDQNMGLHVIPHYLALRAMARFLQALDHAACHDSAIVNELSYGR